MLELNYENLIIFKEKLKDDQISQGLKLRLLETMQEAQKNKFVYTSTRLEKFNKSPKMFKIQKFLNAGHILWKIWVNITSTCLEITWPNIGTYWQKSYTNGKNPLDWQHFKKILIHSPRECQSRDGCSM